MDTRRFRRSSRSDAVAAFRWLGWVMLMMFVLVQTAHAVAGGARVQVDSAEPQKPALSEASGSRAVQELGCSRCPAAKSSGAVLAKPTAIQQELKATT